MSVIEPGESFAVGWWGGVKSVRATLNAVPLDVHGAENHFEFSVGDVEGEGPATLLLTEQFVDDTSFTIPYTVYITSAQTAINASSTALETVDERTIGWGTSDGQAATRSVTKPRRKHRRTSPRPRAARSPCWMPSTSGS